MRRTVQIARQAPDAQSAAADGSMPPAAPPAVDNAPPADASAGQTAGASDVQASQSTDPSAEPVPSQAEDPLKPIHDMVSQLADAVGECVDQVTSLTARIDALEHGQSDEALVQKAQDAMRHAMENISKDFADLPAKFATLQGKLKHMV